VLLAELQEKVEKLEKLLMRLIRIGIVTQVNPEKGSVRVKLPDADGEISDELPVLFKKTGKDKDYWMPDIGEHVLCVFLPYGPEQGFVIGAFYSEVDKVPVTDKNKKRIAFEDGTYMEYDKKQRKLRANLNGDSEINVSGNAKVSIKGNTELFSEGKVIIKGRGTIELDGGSGANQKPIHDASPCPLFGVCHLLPSKTIKISP
jgi:phage baseplate assembly protein V